MYSCIIAATSTCGFPGTPTYGRTTTHISSDGVVLTAMHFCNEGFILDGVNQRTCLSNGSWSDPLPTCVSKCGSLKSEYILYDHILS